MAQAPWCANRTEVLECGRSRKALCIRLRTFPRKYHIIGWGPDGNSLLVTPNGPNDKGVKIYKFNIASGKMDFWKTFGADIAGASSIGAPRFSTDATAYAYIYVRVLSQAYVVKGLK